jgi:hypothetical protein
MTIRQVEIHPEALAEAEAAVAWHGERSSRAPAAFIEEIGYLQLPMAGEGPVIGEDAVDKPFNRRLLRARSGH